MHCGDFHQLEFKKRMCMLFFGFLERMRMDDQCPTDLVRMCKINSKGLIGYK